VVRLTLQIAPECVDRDVQELWMGAMLRHRNLRWLRLNVEGSLCDFHLLGR
jgi:hypothetical protein